MLWETGSLPASLHFLSDGLLQGLSARSIKQKVGRVIAAGDQGKGRFCARESLAISSLCSGKCGSNLGSDDGIRDGFDDN